MQKSARPLPPLAYGGDYNPEQWPLSAQLEDIDLMKAAGVSLVTLGVFSWAHLQPVPGVFEFDWLDEVIDRLHAAGISVDLATATASPPPWLTHQHPEILPITADGVTLWPGGRQAFCPSSPIYREHALALCRAMGERYGDHPAVVLWHVSNEIGCHNALCYCDVSAAAFRAWLQSKYADLDALNDAWGTAFWSQRYTEWAQILPPRTAANFPNPTQQWDFRRFSSDTLLAHFIAERDVLHEVSPGVPVTTNFMVMRHIKEMDYGRWAAELDVVSNDHYLIAADPEAHRELAFSADLTRGVAGGDPWLLMEHSTSAVNWQPRNVAKQPGELLRTSLAHVARGADSVLFFQWRASKAGAEKFHSGMLPHAGTDSRVWREVVGLGEVLQSIQAVTGARSANDVAILFDWDAWWGCELDSHPSIDITYRDQAEAFHAAFTDLGVGVDVVPPQADLSNYRLVVVPTLYTLSPETAARLSAAAEQATVLVTYFSGIVDADDHIITGGYPGLLRDLLGIRVEEFLPLREGESVQLDDASAADVWAEIVTVDSADVVARFADGPAAGGPALTRRTTEAGQAWYLATRLAADALRALCRRLIDESGVVPIAEGIPGVEFVRRIAADGRHWTFVINHTDTEICPNLVGVDLLTGQSGSRIGVKAGGVAVIEGA